MKEEQSASKPEVLSSTADICRDFLRHVCNREQRCKFKHLNGDELTMLVDTRKDPASSNVSYEFCHDFQNKGCDRQNCKFIHCTKEVETEFRDKGLLPLHLKYEFELGVQDICVTLKNLDSTLEVPKTIAQEKNKPICRDFVQRQCRRGKKCRFVHLDQNSNLSNNEYHGKSVHQRQNVNRISQNANENNPEKKRLRLIQNECVSEASVYAVPQENEVTKNITCLLSTQPNASTIQYFKEENLMLRKEVANLRKQVSGLSATNEVLLEQNAQFRLQKRCLAEGSTASFSQAKSYGTQSPLSVSVPIGLSLNVPGQTQQIPNNPGLAGASLLTSDALTVTPVELVNSRPAQQSLNTVSVMPHAAIPAQARIQISRSIPQNTSGLVSNIVTNSQLLDDLHSLTNHQANVGANTAGLHANITPVLQQANLAGQSVASFSITQNTIPISQNLICSMPSITTSSVSGAMLQNPHPSIINGNCSIAGPNSITLNQSPGGQNMAAAGGLVVQANRNLTVEADAESLGHINHNMANAQMTHATLVTTNQQNQSSARQNAGNLSGAIAAVAAQVIAAQGSLAQGNSEIGTAQISVPAVPCGSLGSAIVPVTITTTLPMGAMVPSLSLENSPAGLLATRIEGVAGSQSHGARAPMVSSCPASVVTMSLAQPGHQVVNAISGRHVVSTQQQLNAPINFTINPVASVPQPPGPGMHA